MNMNTSSSVQVASKELPEPNGTEDDSRPVLLLLGESYARVHGYVSVIVCVVSILVNLATVVVLTRRQMVSPSNTMLTGIAVTEIIKLAAYVVYAYEFSLMTQINNDIGYPLGWIYYLIVHASLSLVLYATVTWLTVLLAIFRYVVVCVQHGQQKVTVKLARVTILCVYFFSAIVYIPSYFSLTVVDKTYEQVQAAKESEQVSERNQSTAAEDEMLGEGRTLALSRLGEYLGLDDNVTSSNVSNNVHLGTIVQELEGNLGYTYDVNSRLFSSIKIIHGPVLKLLASVLITVPTTLLVVKMQQAAKKRIILKGSSRRVHDDVESGAKRVTFRERLSSAATIITTLPERISYSMRRQSTRSPDTSPPKKINYHAASSVGHNECTATSNFRNDSHSSSNGESHLNELNVTSKANVDHACVIQVQRVPGSHTPTRSAQSSQKGSQEHHRRTTLLLLAVVMCFVVVEFPHGIMLLIGELSKDFYDNVYIQLGDLLDLVTLCSSSLNFVLYCAMSRQFRTTFSETFIAPLLRCVPCLTRHEQLASSGSVRISYARKRSNSKKPNAAAVVAVSNPKYIAIQAHAPPLIKEEDEEPHETHSKDECKAKDPLLGNGKEPKCLAIPPPIANEVSVSAFSATSQTSGASHTSDGSAASGRSHVSTCTSLTNTTANSIGTHCS